jgi:hypothetical protein
MENTCFNHTSKKAKCFCHVCKNYYCEDCLVEGPEYYYCKNENCQIELNKVLTTLNADKKIKEESKKSSVFYELRKSSIPFYVISLFIASLLGLKFARINELDTVETVFYILGASLALWGMPMIITFLSGFVITVKELRSKIFFYIYTVAWVVTAIVMFASLFAREG